MGSYSYARFPYVTPPELTGGPERRRPVVVIGAGPVGLAAAINLAGRGVPVVVLDDSDVVSVGSRAICWSKRTLEIFDRLGIGDRMVAKGVTWQVGRVFHRDRELYSVDLLPESGHKMPAFVNLQQYYVEQYLVERAAAFPGLIELRWRNEVTALAKDASGVTLEIATPDGPYRLRTDWVIAADGARSPTRTRMGLPFAGQAFEERFLIADIRTEARFPNERLFWFEPPFHPGQSALLHKQPDDVYRVDFQLGPDADPEAERRPERVLPRVRAVLGEGLPFELEWCSVYAFRCARLERFVHGRVIFAGDSAHVVSPFGARGGNGGIQDVDNLGWKLAAVIAGEAPESLLATYDEERGRGADENIAASTRTTNFMTPKSAAERRYRDGVLALAPTLPFARSLLNAGRLSKPCSLDGLSLQQPPPSGASRLPPPAAGEENRAHDDADDRRTAAPVQSAEASERMWNVAPGTACPDAPVSMPDGTPGWLLNALGLGFTILTIAGPDGPGPEGLADLPTAPTLLVVGTGPGHLGDPFGMVASRYGPADTTYVIRPDQHVAARFGRFDPAALAAALARASCGQADARRAAA